ncbi:MAG: hypothetical protein IPM24_17675 [Bryobacterales bacterium]|nr:hypothetical protein [Bryobacterales bacterium]
MTGRDILTKRGRWTYSNAAVFLAAAAFASVFFINYCDWVFDCGCQSLWAGAADHCNIHSGPRYCPWCARNPAPAYLGIVIPQALIAFRRGPWSWYTRLAAALAAFPVCGGIAALIYGWTTGYWS